MLGTRQQSSGIQCQTEVEPLGGHNIDSRWLSPVDEEDRIMIPELGEEWTAKHMLRSRYFVMFKKCEDLRCCQPYRSPLLSRLPNGFLPALRVFGHDENGQLKLVSPEAVDKTVKFVFLSNILSQPIQQSIPLDTYNKKVSVDDLLCPFCKI